MVDGISRVVLTDDELRWILVKFSCLWWIMMMVESILWELITIDNVAVMGEIYGGEWCDGVIITFDDGH